MINPPSVIPFFEHFNNCTQSTSFFVGRTNLSTTHYVLHTPQFVVVPLLLKTSLSSWNAGVLIFVVGEGRTTWWENSERCSSLFSHQCGSGVIQRGSSILRAAVTDITKAAPSFEELDAGGTYDCPCPLTTTSSTRRFILQEDR